MWLLSYFLSKSYLQLITYITFNKNCTKTDDKQSIENVNLIVIKVYLKTVNNMKKLKVGSYTIDITNEDKIYFPKDITKGELIDYYDKISEYMLKHIKDRPLMLQRFPEGITGQFFYQKNAPNYFPSWIKTVLVPKHADEGDTNFTLCQNKATLLYLANFGTITFHGWLSRFAELHDPDKLIFDLDPSVVKDFASVIKVAIIIRDLLEQVGLTPHIMTTGSHGMHVVAPIKTTVDFKYAKKFADGCARIILKQYPDLVTMQLRKDKRENKIFIDTLRNQFGATAVIPYSVRPYPKAPVATPLEWHELENKKLISQTYNIENIFDRLEQIGDDPWKDIYKKKKSLETAWSKLEKILDKNSLV